MKPNLLEAAAVELRYVEGEYLEVREPPEQVRLRQTGPRPQQGGSPPEAPTQRKTKAKQIH